MIKSGYMLEITSWENDGDFYNTKRIDGLTEDEVRWYSEFFKEYSRLPNKYGRKSSYDFLYVINEVNSLLGYSLSTIVFDSEDEDNNLGVTADFVYEILGSDEQGYYRTYDSHKIYFILHELQDLSKEF